MSTTPRASPPRVAVEVAGDRLAAYLVLNLGEGETPPGYQEILDALGEAGIDVNEGVRDRVQEVVRVMAEGAMSERFLITRGRPVVEGKDAEFIWDDFFEQAVEPWREEAPIDYYTSSAIVTADAGQTLGRLVPAVPGQAGVDVYGRLIPPKRCPAQITLHESVASSADDPNQIVSRVPGRVEYSNRTLAVNEVLDIRGDVDFETGSIRSSVDVCIGGTIRDYFHVNSEKSINVSGAIEAAEVRATGDVTVRGGILGRHCGRVRADGRIVAKFCDRACLIAGGDIMIARQVMDSRIHTDRKLCAERAAVIAGLIYAREGAQVASLGSEAHVPTVIVLGVHWNILKKSRTIDRSIEGLRKMAAQIRERVDPILADDRHINRKQKQRATELLLKVQELELKVAERRQRRDRMLKEGRADEIPGILVSKMIHPGVCIRINNRQVIFDREVKGPVRIEKRSVEGCIEFVAVNQITGSLAILSSEHIEGDPTPLKPRH